MQDPSDFPEQLHSFLERAEAPRDELLDARDRLHRQFHPTESDLKDLPIMGMSPAAIVKASEPFLEDIWDQSATFHKAINVHRTIDQTEREEMLDGRGPLGALVDRLGIFGLESNGTVSRISPIGFDVLRAVADIPIFNACVMTRQRQVARFCQPSVREADPGFVIERCYQDDDGTESEDKADRERIRWMTKFFVNCGDVFNARGRKMMKRDTFTALMAKLVRDTYTFDANPIETEEGIDGPSKGKPVGLYAHDGSTFRNCAIQDDEVSGDENENSEYPPIAAQVIHQQVVQTFTPAQLIFDPRNPRSDIRMCGYGYSEAEMAIRIVTGWLNSYNTNARGQDENRIAPGVLTLIGDYGKSQVDDFRRQWTLLGRGIAPRWGLPVMSSKTKDGGVVWTPLGPQFNEQMFKAWMTFLTALICGLIGMDPQEVNFESFVVGKSSLSGSDTAERLASSKDKGLEPLLGYYQGLWSDYVVPCHFEDFRFRFTGLHPELLETRKATIEKAGTVNEYRAIEGLPPIPKKSGWGDLPINPALAQYVAPTIESLQPPQPAPMTPDQGAAAAGMSPEDAQRMMAHNQGTPGGPPGPAHPPQPGQPGQDKGAAMQAARGGAAARPGATAEQPRQVVRKALMFDVEVIQ